MERGADTAVRGQGQQAEVRPGGVRGGTVPETTAGGSVKRGCLNQLLYLLLLAVVFGGSSYFWFNFFVRGRSVQTPALVGKNIAQARAIASDAGLRLEIDRRKDRNAQSIPVGAVAWQNRTPGNLVKRGTRIYVGLSLGPLVLSVPDLSGQSPRTALLRFSQRNLKLGNIAYVDHEGREGIVAEDPPQGTVVQGQTAVSLLVGFSPAPAAYVMPDLIDRALDSVRPLLEARGLTVTNVKFEQYPGIRDGIIIRQYPLGGAPVTARDPITLVVSRQESAEVPPETPLP